MKIRGEFKDVMSKNGVIVEDKGWISNRIVPEFGNFLAAVMKKDFKVDQTIKPVGIEYIAVGSKSKSVDEFRNRVEKFFKKFENINKPLGDNSNGDYSWIWVKKIKADNIKYLSDDNEANDQVTNKLQVRVDFGPDEPDSPNSLRFEEFALLGILEKSKNQFDTDRMFFINHASHGVIEKGKDVTMERTINLTFPINQEVVS